MSRSFPYVMLLIVIVATLVGIVAIGELLLLVRSATGDNKLTSVFVALALTILFGGLGAFLSFRATKLPPVQLPQPVAHRAPARRFDLGAGYLIGQYALIVGAMLLLLFVILAVR